MPETHDYAIQTFNRLIETTIDSADGYEKAADLARNPRFQDLFRQKEQKRRQLAVELEDRVRGLGGEPWDKGSFRGVTHRAFLELRDRIGGGHSDKPVIEEVERGESFIRDQFAAAAQDAVLPEEARRSIERDLGAIQAEHDEIAAIGREFDPAPSPAESEPNGGGGVEPVQPVGVQPSQT